MPSQRQLHGACDFTGLLTASLTSLLCNIATNAAADHAPTEGNVSTGSKTADSDGIPHPDNPGVDHVLSKVCTSDI